MRAWRAVVHGGEVILPFEVAGERREAWFRLPAGVEPPAGGDASLAAALLPAMRNDEDLEVEEPVSPRLLAATETVQDVFCSWDRALRPRARWYHRVTVTAPTAPAEAPPGRGTLAPLTGGVDSLHIAITRRPELDALFFVHGFDVPLADRALRDEVSGRLAQVAEALGVPLLELETDLQAFGDATGVGWPDYHGAALATVALLLGRRFGRFLVPSTHTYAHLEGTGSHPLLDRLWSTEALEVEHVGAASTRVDKLRSIVDVPAARDHLRVCWENRGGAYNCGRCEKCIRTGVAVRIAGAEGRFPTIPAPSLRRVAGVRATGRASPWHELRLELVALDANPRLRRAIDLVLARHQLHQWSWTKRWVP